MPRAVKYRYEEAARLRGSRGAVEGEEVDAAGADGYGLAEGEEVLMGAVGGCGGSTMGLGVWREGKGVGAGEGEVRGMMSNSVKGREDEARAEDCPACTVLCCM
jgi:hypothetical protein